MADWGLSPETTTIPPQVKFNRELVLVIPKAVLKPDPIFFNDISEKFPAYRKLYTLYFALCYECLRFRARSKKKEDGVGGGSMPDLSGNPQTLEDANSMSPRERIEQQAQEQRMQLTREVENWSSLLDQVGNLPSGGDFNMELAESTMPEINMEEDSILELSTKKKRKTPYSATKEGEEGEKKRRSRSKQKKTHSTRIDAPPPNPIDQLLDSHRPPKPTEGMDDLFDDDEPVGDDDEEVDQSERDCEMYMEALMDVDQKEVLYYVFHFFIKSGRINPNTRLAAMIAANFKRRQKQRNPEVFPKHEKWKHIANGDHLAQLLKLYLNTGYAAIDLKGAATDITNPENPLCATKFFSRGNALLVRGLCPGYVRQEAYRYCTSSLRQVKFPAPEYMYKLNVHDINPEVFLDRYLPDYQRAVCLATNSVISAAFNRNEAKVELPAGMSTDQGFIQWVFEHYGGFKMVKAGDYTGSVEREHENFNDYDAGLYGKIKTIIDKYRDLVSKVINSTPGNHKHLNRFLYLITSQFAFDAYDRVCRGTYEGLSPTGENIQKAIVKERYYDNMDHFITKHNHRDTFHLCHAKRFYHAMYFVFDMMNSQNLASLALKYGYSAFIVDFRTVKCHLMVNSERGGNGKSFFMDIVKDYLRIGLTTVAMTFTTMKSWGGDKKQQNDANLYIDEMSKNDLDSKMGEGERVFKFIMSNNRYIIRYMQLGESTERNTATSQSEWIISIVATNNEPRLFTSTMSPALQRRWDLRSWNESVGQDMDRRIADAQLMEISGMRQCNSDKSKEIVSRGYRIEQALVFDTCKFIYIGALKSISHDLGSVFLWCLNEYLPSKGYGSPLATDQRYVLNLIDVEVILDAVRAVFINETRSPHDPEFGKPISIKSADFREVDRYLYVCSRHIVAALGDAGEKMFDPFEYDVRRALRTLFVERLKFADFSSVHARTSNSQHHPTTQQVGQSTTYVAVGTGRSDEEKIKDIDFSYCRFYVNDGLVSLAKKLQSIMREHKYPIIPSCDRIHDSLLKLTKRTIQAYPNKHYPIPAAAKNTSDSGAQAILDPRARSSSSSVRPQTSTSTSSSGAGTQTPDSNSQSRPEPEIAPETALLQRLKTTKEAFKNTELGKMSYFAGHFVLSPRSVPLEVFRNPPKPYATNAAHFENTKSASVYTIHRDMLADVGKPCKEIMADFIRHMFTFRHQKAQNFAYGVLRADQTELEVLSVPDAKPDAPIFKFQKFDHNTWESTKDRIREAEALGLPVNRGNARLKTIVIDKSYDIWACERRNEDLSLTKTAISPDIYRCDKLFSDTIVEDVGRLGETVESFFMGIPLHTYQFIQKLTPEDIVSKAQELFRRSSSSTRKLKADADFNPNLYTIYQPPAASLQPNPTKSATSLQPTPTKPATLYHWETILGNEGKRVSYMQYREESRTRGFCQLFDSVRDGNYRRVVFNHNMHLYKWILPHHEIQDHLYGIQRKSRFTQSLEPYLSLVPSVDDNGSLESTHMMGAQTPMEPGMVMIEDETSQVASQVGEDESLVGEDDIIRACSYDLEALFDLDENPRDASFLEQVADMGDKRQIAEEHDEDGQGDDEDMDVANPDDDSGNEGRAPVNATTREIDGEVYGLID